MNREQRRAQLFKHNAVTPTHGGMMVPKPDKRVEAKWFHTSEYVVIVFSEPPRDLKLTVAEGRQWVVAMTDMLDKLEAYQKAPEQTGQAPEKSDG